MIVARAKKYKHKILKIQCNNAGENIKHVQEIANKHHILLERTAPNTPQMNGLVERRIAVLKNMGKTMMEAAQMTKQTQRFLWPEAIQ